MSDTFGHHLVRWREAAGLTQGELARRVGMTPTYIDHLEREVDPTGMGERPRLVVEVVDAIAGALGVPVAEARCAAGYDPPEGSSASCEVVRNTFGESDFAALQHMYEQLNAEQRRTFQPILEMVSRELELVLRIQNLEGTPTERRRRPGSSRRLPARRPEVSLGHAPAFRAGAKVPDEH